MEVPIVELVVRSYNLFIRVKHIKRSVPLTTSILNHTVKSQRQHNPHQRV